MVDVSSSKSSWKITRAMEQMLATTTIMPRNYATNWWLSMPGTRSKSGRMWVSRQPPFYCVAPTTVRTERKINSLGGGTQRTSPSSSLFRAVSTSLNFRYLPIATVIRIQHIVKLIGRVMQSTIRLRLCRSTLDWRFFFWTNWFVVYFSV